MSSDTQNVDLTFLARQNEKVLTELAAVRREIADVRILVLGSVDSGRRLERRLDETTQRISELKDDLSLMVKAEISGSFAGLETRLDHRLERIEDQLDDMVRRSPRT